jgi:2-dehydro-3-deoxygalactonokinase
MIGVDWGTTSLRAFRIEAAYRIIDVKEAPLGLMAVPDRRFAEVLRELVGAWLDDGEDRILLSGMVGSRQGWREAPYIPCPAGQEEIAASLQPVTFDGARAFIVPGLSSADAEGVAEVMRGEETQILGIDAAEALICLPGSHSKWAIIEGGRIKSFTTYMTGEAFAALGAHTILARGIEKAPVAAADFVRGLERAAQPGGLLHHLFGIRTLGLTGALASTAGWSYLSGLLIGHEVGAALAAHPDRDESVRLLGDPALCDLYTRALAWAGRAAVTETRPAAALGLARIGELASWT